MKLVALVSLLVIGSLGQDRAKYAEDSKDTAFPTSRAVESAAAFPAVNLLDYIAAGRRSAVTACSSSDDLSPAFDRAIAAVPKGGGQISLPAGCYTISRSIVLSGHPNILLLGASMKGTRIQAMGNFPAIVDEARLASVDSGTGVQRLSIRCAGKDLPNAHGIKFTYVNAGLIRDVYLNACRHALDMSDQWETVIDNVQVEGAGTDQGYIGLFTGAPTDLTDTMPNNALIISNSRFQNMAKYGAEMRYFAGTKMVSTEFAGAGEVGMLLCGTRYVRPEIRCQFGHFTNVLVDSVTGPGIVVRQGNNSQSVKHLMFYNSWIGSTLGAGLTVDGGTSIAFRGVHISLTDTGILAHNSAELAIQGELSDINYRNNGSDALVLDGTADSLFEVTNPTSSFPMRGTMGLVERNGSHNNTVR